MLYLQPVYLVFQIKNLYQHTINEEVIPQVTGFTETATPPTSTHNSNDTEITVNFKIMFLPGHQSNPGPLEAAVKSNSLGDLVLYPTSFVLTCEYNKKSTTVLHLRQLVHFC